MALARALARTKKAAARSSRRDASGAFARRAFRGLTPFGCTSFAGSARFRGRTCCAGRAQMFLQLFEVAQDGLFHLLDVATCVPQEPRYVFAKVFSACPDAAADRTQLLLGGLECCLDASDRTSVLLEACTRGCGHTWASSRFFGDRFTRGCCFGSGGFPSFGFTYWRHRCSFVLELQHALPPRFSQFSAARPRESRPRSLRVRDSARSARRPYWTARRGYRAIRALLLANPSRQARAAPEALGFATDGGPRTRGLTALRPRYCRRGSSRPPHRRGAARRVATRQDRPAEMVCSQQEIGFSGSRALPPP